MKPTRFYSVVNKLICGLLCFAMVLSLLPAMERPVEAATTGYDRGYNQGMAGSGKIVAHGLDVSAWQESGLNFQNIKNAGYKYVILRCGTSYGKDKCFEEYYNSARAAGLDIGCYFYSYALNKATAQQEANSVISWIKGKTFEYPVYFDFEDPTQVDLSYSLSADICRGFMDVIAANGYLAGIYSMSWILNRTWIDTSGIRAKYEGWVAHVYSDADNTGITSGQFNIYKEQYQSVYGMHQYSFTTYVNGVGPFDANVTYKDYPSIVKTYGFNGYDTQTWIEKACFDPTVYRTRYKDLEGRTEEQLLEHWKAYGIKEGRCASTILDLKYYVESNPDLKTAYGTDYTKAYNHFITKGYKEYRKSSLLFDGEYYTENNPDVDTKFKEIYLKHYIDTGMKEGRRASLTYDPDYYWVIRPDVYEKWPDDRVAAAKHYAGFGVRDNWKAYDDELPLISDVEIYDLSAEGYTVSCTVTDNWGVEKVAFPSWVAVEGTSDVPDDFMNTQIGTRDGDTFTFRVNASEHGGKGGYYVTHIYAVDKGDNVAVMNLEAVDVKDIIMNLQLIQDAVVSIQDGFLKDISPQFTAQALLQQFDHVEPDLELELLDPMGEPMEDTAIVGTGCTVSLYYRNKVMDSVTVVMLGDLDGSGTVDTTDYLRIKAYLLSSFDLTAAQIAAADVDVNGRINTTDYLRIKAHFLGEYNLNN